MYPSDVCTSPTFVLVRRLYRSDVCTGPTFVRPTFVLSDVCGVRCLCVRRLYWQYYIGNKHRKFQNLYNRSESNSTTVQFTPLLPNRIFIFHKKKKYVLRVYIKILQIVILQMANKIACPRPSFLKKYRTKLFPFI